MLNLHFSQAIYHNWKSFRFRTSIKVDNIELYLKSQSVKIVFESLYEGNKQMNYRKYTIELLFKLGINHRFKSCEYIISSIEFIHTQKKYVIPDSEMIYTYISSKYSVAPVAIENSIRNTIQNIWANKINLTLMGAIFGNHNLDKRPCNMEFLMLMYNYIKYTLDFKNQLKEAEKAE